MKQKKKLFSAIALMFKLMVYNMSTYKNETQGTFWKV